LDPATEYKKSSPMFGRESRPSGSAVIEPKAGAVGVKILFFFMGLMIAACTFDYSAAGTSEKSKPDIVMENLEYVRVRGGDPLVRFQAEYAERWEDRQTMELRDFLFEQMEDGGKTINAEGRAGQAVVQLGSGDISLKGGVRIRVDSEDVTIRTAELEWKDKDKTLTSGEQDEVDIQRSDGTSFAGRGFLADARNRTWSFSGEVKGTYVEKEDEKEGGETAEITVSSEAGMPEKIVEEPEPTFGSMAAEAEGRGSPPEPAALPEQYPEPKPSLPEQFPEPKPSLPEQFPEPKPSIPSPEQYVPELPEDK